MKPKDLSRGKLTSCALFKCKFHTFDPSIYIIFEKEMMGGESVNFMMLKSIYSSKAFIFFSPYKKICISYLY